MAYPWHYLFSFGGSLLGGLEQWSNNIRFVGSGNEGDEYDEEDIAQGLLEVMRDGIVLEGATGLGYSNQTRLEWAKFNKIGPDGKYASATDANTVYLPSPGVAGVTPPASNAPQLALAISWGTVRERGRASKGRIFIPMPVAPVSTNGMIATATRDALASAWAAQIDRLNDRAQNTAQERPIAAVVSGVDASFEPISRVRVGSVMDTQRRRRNALDEAYSSADVPDSA